MQQGVHTANVDEGPVVGEAANGAVYRAPFLQFRVTLLLDGLLFLLRHNATIHHNVLFGGVEFYNTAANLLLDQLLHLRRVTHAASRSRHERAYSHVNVQPTFHDSYHDTDDRGPVVKGLLQCRPVGWASCLAASQLVIALRIAALDRNLQLVPGIRRLTIAGKLRSRQDAFCLEPNVENH